MKLKLPLFNSKLPGMRSFYSFHPTRAYILMSGVLLLFAATLAMILWSGFLFHKTVLAPAKEAAFTPFSSPALSSRKIDDIIRRLDERGKKLKEILAEINPPPAALDNATTTSAQ